MIFFAFIETLVEDFHSDYMTGRMWKVDPNESVSLDHFFLCEVVCIQGGLSGLRRGGRTFWWVGDTRST